MKQTQRQKRRWVLLLILLGGFVLRVYRLGVQSLWYDETVSAYLASQALPDLLAHTAGDIHPPGYYILLHLWTFNTGNTEFALAFLSLCFGVLLIALGYTLARALLGDRTAMWAAFLVAISPFNVWYSQEVRMYTIGAALVMIGLWCTLNIVDAREQSGRGHRFAWGVGYVLAAVSGLYTLYYFAFLLVALNLVVFIHLLCKRDRQNLVVWTLAQTVVLVLYLPWLPVAWRQVTNPPVPAWRSAVPLPEMALEAWTAMSLGQSARPAQVWPWLIVAGVLLLLGIRLAWNRKCFLTSQSNVDPGSGINIDLNPAVLLLACSLGPLAMMWLLSLLVPVYHVRYLFTFATPLIILIAAGLAWLAERRFIVAIVAALVGVAASGFSIYQLHTNPAYAADDLRAAAEFLADNWRPGDVILINAGYAYPGFTYYFQQPVSERLRLVEYQPSSNSCDLYPLVLQTGSIGGEANLGWDDLTSDFYATTEAETSSALEQLVGACPRLWVFRVYDTVTDPDGFIRDWLERNTTPFEDRRFSGPSSMRVQGFLSPIQPTPPPGESVAFEEGLILVGRQVTPVAKAGEWLDVVLWWQSTQPSLAARSPLAVSLKLWGLAGTGEGEEVYLAAQKDDWPVGGLLLTPDWPLEKTLRYPMRLWLPDDLPAGQYWLDVEVYDSETMAPLLRTDGQGHVVPLGGVNVADQP